MITGRELLKIGDERKRQNAARLIEQALATVRDSDASADVLRNAAADIETATRIIRLLAQIKAEGL